MQRPRGAAVSGTAAIDIAPVTDQRGSSFGGHRSFTDFGSFPDTVSWHDLRFRFDGTISRSVTVGGVDIYSLSLNRLDGSNASLAQWRGSPTLIVNVASKCGLTPQYTQLEQLHERFAPHGFSVLGFPCNQFGGQEPGNAEQIAQFCSATYGVTFPMFEKSRSTAPTGIPCIPT